MRIAILGASGFVGSAVASAANAAGHDVVAVPAPRIRSTARGTRAVRAAAEFDAGDAAPVPDARDAAPAPDDTTVASAPDASDAVPVSDARDAAPAPDTSDAGPAPGALDAALAPDGTTATTAHRDRLAIVAHLSHVLAGTEVVINAAGLAAPGSAMTDELVGANAVLPGMLARAAARAGAKRLVHISSAAVHGDARVLDAAADPRPISPYGFSKLWGEQALSAAVATAGIDAVIYRPTSVHGPGRSVTDQIRRLARSPLATVAAPGDDPTPQVMVEQVAALALQFAAAPEVPSTPVIHPWEGWTTSSFLQHLGEGRHPLRIPRILARSGLAVAKTAGRLHPRVAAQARRLEMLWFGQRQLP